MTGFIWHGNDHYVAYLVRGQQWYCLNDAVVTEVSQADLPADPYMIFLQKVVRQLPNQAQRCQMMSFMPFGCDCQKHWHWQPLSSYRPAACRLASSVSERDPAWEGSRGVLLTRCARSRRMAALLAARELAVCQRIRRRKAGVGSELVHKTSERVTDLAGTG